MEPEQGRCCWVLELFLLRRARIFVSGRVQGVWYRASALEKARELEIRGWVRNLPDGRVELMVEASPSRVEALVRWCHIGPPGAWVEQVEICDDTAGTDLADFHVRYS